MSSRLIGILGAADGIDLCAGPIGGNVPPYDLNRPDDDPDMGWASPAGPRGRRTTCPTG